MHRHYSSCLLNVSQSLLCMTYLQVPLLRRSLRPVGPAQTLRPTFHSTHSGFCLRTRCSTRGPQVLKIRNPEDFENSLCLGHWNSMKYSYRASMGKLRKEQNKSNIDANPKGHDHTRGLYMMIGAASRIQLNPESFGRWSIGSVLTHIILKHSRDCQAMPKPG